MKCSNCGTVNSPQAAACATCTLPLDGSKRSAANSQRPAPRAGKPAALRLFALSLGLVVAGGVAWLVTQKSASEPVVSSVATEIVATPAVEATAAPVAVAAPSPAPEVSAVPSGAVELAAPDGKGEVPRDVLERVIRQNSAAVRKCYEEGLKRDPDLAGSLMVRFVIGNEGRVVLAAAEDSDIDDAAVVACVVRQFRNLSFPPTTGGTVSIRFPVKFNRE